MARAKTLLRVLAGEARMPPPVWVMRQAGRYLPEYQGTRTRAGDFLSLCYTPELAAEVTLQPIRRYDFDAAILFADILLVPQALGVDLWFVEGKGPRLSVLASQADFERLKPAEAIHDTLAPIYQTVRILSRALPGDTALIGFAGAPWTVATYMIAGRGTPDHAPAKRLLAENPSLFEALIWRITEATITYLGRQIESGAEVVKLFDSWAGALKGEEFTRFVVEPCRTITQALKTCYPQIPVIAYPRGAGNAYAGFADVTGVDCVALDSSVDPDWAARHVPSGICVQGNLDSGLLVTGGDALVKATRRIVDAFAGRPHIFNLGHGITPDADPENVTRMIATIQQYR